MPLDSRTTRTCFVIAPIGEEESPTRRVLDGLLTLLRQSLGDLVGKITAAHEISEPGNIPSQVITALLESDLVVADLTTLNPNVMYELAVRHCAAKPFVLLAQKGTRLPFDIAPERVLFYANDLAGAESLRRKLRASAEEALSERSPDNPVYTVTQASALRGAASTTDFQRFVLDRLDSLHDAVRELASPQRITVAGHRPLFSYSIVARGTQTALTGFVSELQAFPTFGKINAEKISDGRARLDYSFTTPMHPAEFELAARKSECLLESARLSSGL